MTTPDTTIEETWWEVTTQTGLILLLPAPSPSTEPSTLFLYLQRREPVASHSQITGFTYVLDMPPVLCIRAFRRTQDPDRLAKARLKLASSQTSSPFGPDHESRSAVPGSRRGPSTGATSKSRIH